jgi:hypothetical protein
MRVTVVRLVDGAAVVVGCASLLVICLLFVRATCGDIPVDVVRQSRDLPSLAA